MPSPYFGQAAWFLYWHHESLPSAAARYQQEIIRVFGVLERVLSKQAWLLGERCTVADIAFVQWNERAFESFVREYEGYRKGDFPAVEA